MKFLKKFENFNDFGRFSDEDQKTLNTPQEDVYNDEVDDDIEDEEDFIEDEIIESKKINAGFKAYLDKQKKKREKMEDKADESKDKVEDKTPKKEEKSGLTDKQKKLPEALQKAILAKKK
ncbi:MAG: hypothetical protein M0R46_14125 [Candidatus Muirbacterium halophilum]|nr:hypothetical protein [Candidatus Muirbacterium halophilum]